HSHPDTDDLFLVLEGRLTIDLRDRSVELGPGELFVVPRGVEPRPRAGEETHILLIEPAGTPNTGPATEREPARGGARPGGARGRRGPPCPSGPPGRRTPATRRGASRRPRKRSESPSARQ